MKIKGAIAIGLATMLTLSACGSDDDAGEAPSDTVSDTTSDEPTSDDASEVEADDGADFEAMVAEAEAEGSVLWYTSIPEPGVIAAIEAFEATYDIDVEFVRGLEGQMAQRFVAEKEAGDVQADLFTFSAHPFFEQALADGWLDPLTVDEVPSIAGWPSDFLYNDAYALVSVQPLGIAYNSDLTETPPTDWTDLFTEEFADGQTVFGDPTITAYLSLMYLLEQEYGTEWLEGLAAQDYTLAESMVPGTQGVAAGEGILAIPALASVVLPLQNEGAPLELIIPDLTTGVEQLAALIDGGPHPKAARLFINWLMSPEGQTVLVKGTAASVLDGVEGGLELPSDYRKPDVPAALAAEDDIRAALGL